MSFQPIIQVMQCIEDFLSSLNAFDTTVYPQVHIQCGLQQISQLGVVGVEMSRGLGHSNIYLLIRQINKQKPVAKICGYLDTGHCDSEAFDLITLHRSFSSESENIYFSLLILHWNFFSDKNYRK